MTSYTDATETASIGEGKRNRKTQALSALLSATALGVFLEGCGGEDVAGAGESPLYFADANGINDFSFARVVDSPDDVIITVGGVSETIEGFADDVYTLYYGSLGTGTKLGKLSVGTEEGDTLHGNDFVANVMIGLGFGDELYGGAGADFIYGGAGSDFIKGDAGNDYIQGDEGNDIIEGNGGEDEIYGGTGVDELYGHAGTDTYVFRVGDSIETMDGTDTIVDTVGDTMILRFEGSSYGADDFTSAVFERVASGRPNDNNRINLVITLDLDPNDGIVDKITIRNAYNDNPNIGTGNAAFTINIEYGEEGGTFTQVVDVWSGLT